MGNKNNINPNKTITNIFVTVDTCAELGGQPYKVIEALHDVYNITKRRNLTYIDTAQGLFEKSEYLARDMMELLGYSQRKFSDFVKKNNDWIDIVETDTCKDFREELSKKVFPKMVDPITTATEKAVEIIQKEAFKLMKKRGITHLEEQEIKKPKDIHVRVKFFQPEICNDKKGFAKNTTKLGHYVFVPKIVSEAADKALSEWKEYICDDLAFNKKSRKTMKKGDMAMMVNALQETKAVAHTLLSKLSPDLSEQMGEMPDPIKKHYQAGEQITLDILRNHSHLYGNMSFPNDNELGELREIMQAVRLTNLWPWAHKDMLSKESVDLLHDIHKNIADVSYLDLFTNILPEFLDPEDSLYILLSHDVPLRRQFLEVSTGINEKKTKKQTAGNGVYEETNIYKKLNLKKRDIEEYPHEAVLVGSEFVSFAYMEVLAALSPYIEHEEVHSLSKLIRKNGPDNNIDVGDALLNTIISINNIPEDLQKALERLSEAVITLETYVIKDIQAYGELQKNGHYEKQKAARLNARHGILHI